MRVLRAFCMLWVVFSIIVPNVTQMIKQEVKPEDIDEYFRYFKIVPKDIPYSPAEILYAKYQQVDVNFGNLIDVLDTLIKPKVSWNDTDEEAEPDSLYTLMFVNLDLGDPSYLHWMVSNIHHGNLKNATVVKKYKFPDPPMNNNNPYRMVFLVYRQPDLKPYPYNAKFFLGRIPNRSIFSIQAFLDQYNFTEYPVAGNYFLQETRLSGWLPLNPPEWMLPFKQYIQTHPHGMWETLSEEKEDK